MLIRDVTVKHLYSPDFFVASQLPDRLPVCLVTMPRHSTQGVPALFDTTNLEKATTGIPKDI